MKKKCIAFICIGNTSRSQMAESRAKKIAGSNISICSAGTRPGSGIKEKTKEIMTEVGCNMDGQNPSPLSPLPSPIYHQILIT